MAEAFVNKLGSGKLIAESAGTEPDVELNPTVVQAMNEIGYDMSGHHPKVMTLEIVNTADKIITMGCGVESGVCPASFVSTEDWGLEDPKDQSIEKVREIRDQIMKRVNTLIAEMGE
jgi:arsenate reductase